MLKQGNSKGRGAVLLGGWWGGGGGRGGEGGDMQCFEPGDGGREGGNNIKHSLMPHRAFSCRRKTFQTDLPLLWDI